MGRHHHEDVFEETKIAAASKLLLTLHIAVLLPFNYMHALLFNVLVKLILIKSTFVDSRELHLVF